MGKHGVPYEWIDILEHPEHTREILDKAGGKRVLPTIVLEDGDVLLRPTNLELARKLDFAAHESQLLAADHHWRRSGQSHGLPLHCTGRDGNPGHRARGSRGQRQFHGLRV